MHWTKVRQFEEALLAFTRRDMSLCALLMSGSLDLVDQLAWCSDVGHFDPPDVGGG